MDLKKIMLLARNHEKNPGVRKISCLSRKSETISIQGKMSIPRPKKKETLPHMAIGRLNDQKTST